FSEASSVKFGHREAIEFSVDSDTLILTSIPKTAGTGRLSIATPSGIAHTDTEFRVVSEYGGSVYAVMSSDDTFIRSTKPSTNYHDSSELRVRKTHSGIQTTLLKFPAIEVLGPVINAKIRLLVIEEGGNDGGTAHTISNNYDNTTVAWDEVGINWSNAPRLTRPALSPTRSVYRGDIVEFNVLPAIMGNGPYSFAIRQSNADVVKYSSKEGGFPPELIIKTGLELSKTGLVSEAVTIDGFSQQIPLPNRLTLGRNYPNPFYLETTIEYRVPTPSDVQLRIFNLRGQEVRRLVDEHQTPGFKLARWNGQNDLGLVVASGVYVVMLRVGNETIGDKMILQKFLTKKG
ncbi:DNRLRE domain-containing protein, partial [bacterium]|nr:DNRLRE domain-containing protein [bacterium]